MRQAVFMSLCQISCCLQSCDKHFLHTRMLMCAYAGPAVVRQVLKYVHIL